MVTCVPVTAILVRETSRFVRLSLTLFRKLKGHSLAIEVEDAKLAISTTKAKPFGVEDGTIN